MVHKRFTHSPLFKELPGDGNLVVLRHHRHSELFEALSFVGRKGSRIVALFQVFQQGSEEFPGNYDFAVASNLALRQYSIA
jgi:hypothetical protein